MNTPGATCEKSNSSPTDHGHVYQPPPSYSRLTEARNGLLRRLIRRAFCLPTGATTVTYVQHQIASRHLGVLLPASETSQKVITVLIPTYVGRCSEELLWRTIERLGMSMVLAQREHPECKFLFAMAMQWQEPSTERDCIEQLIQVESKWSQEFDIKFIGLALTPKSKLRALNSCIPILDAVGSAVVCWIDDDIIVDERCLTELLTAYDPAFEGVYGARKITVPDQGWFSSVWARHKNRIEPINLYPHGCCILMSRREFHGGIPLVYQTDDHYYLLRYLEPENPDPLSALRVVPQALLYCPTANRPSTMMGRIRRNYTNVLRVLADAPASTSRFFLHQLMFPNLRLPTSFADLGPCYWNALLWHFLKLLFWLTCLIPVLVRGIFNRPIVLQWYSAPFPSSLGRDSNGR